MRYESNWRILRILRKCEGAAPLAAGRKRVNEARFATRRRARRKGARVPGPDLEVRAERRHLRLSRGHRFASARRGRARGRGRGARVANGHPAALGRLAVVAFPFRRSSVHARRVLEPRATRRLRAGRGDDESRSRERRRRHGAGFASCAVSARASLGVREKQMDEAKKADSAPSVCREFASERHLRFRSARFSSGFLPVHRPGTASIVVISRCISLVARMISAAPARAACVVPEITPIIARRRVGATHPPLVR